MCTAIDFMAKDHYFGRNLDLEIRYKESVVITPRNYVFNYKNGKMERADYAMIGIATVMQDYPLYYDATNEYGLSIAGLNFVGNAHLEKKCVDGMTNLAPYELIPFLLGRCRNVDECERELEKISLVDIPFMPGLQNAQLHWLICDKERSITVEFVREGKRIYENPVGVLTNNPPFDYQMMNLNNYLNLTSSEPNNRFSDKFKLEAYSKGMGAMGMPGDMSSCSRFVRAVFNKLNSVKPDAEEDAVGQMFHILSSVEYTEGSVKVGDKYEKTQYTSCCNTDKCIYYYRTYENSQICAVNMYNEDLDGESIISFEVKYSQNINYIN